MILKAKGSPSKSPFRFTKSLAFLFLFSLLQSCELLTGDTNGNKKETLSLSNGAFDTDRAELNDKGTIEVNEMMKKILSNFTNESEFLRYIHNKKITLHVSSDQRKTVSYRKGNEGLSYNRAENLEKEIKIIIQKKYPDVNLDKITFVKLIPHGDGFIGFTPITKIINPSTGKFYTNEEFIQLNDSEKKNIYELCRFANIEISPINNSLEGFVSEFTNEMGGYYKNFILLDKSPSMIDNISDISVQWLKELQSYQNNKLPLSMVIPIDSTTYINEMIYLQNPYKKNDEVGLSDITKAVKQKTGSIDEKVVKSCLEFINTVSKNPQSYHISFTKDHTSSIHILTDEGIQNFSIKQLEELQDQSKKYNLDIYFKLLAEKGGTYISLSLDQVKSLLEKHINKVINESIETYLTQNQNTKNQINKTNGCKGYLKQIAEAGIRTINYSVNHGYLFDYKNPQENTTKSVYEYLKSYMELQTK